MTRRREDDDTTPHDAPKSEHHDAAAMPEPPGLDAHEQQVLRATVERRRTRQAGTRRASEALKARYANARSPVEIFADRLTRFSASTPFLLFHIAWFTGWIGWNVGVGGRHPFDPFPFGLLTMIVSLEAIFLSIFVLLAQSRESQIAELREEITLQVILRAEEEITKTLQLVAGLYQRLDLQLAEDADLHEMLKPLDERRIERDLLKQIDDSTGKTTAQPHGAKGNAKNHAKSPEKAHAKAAKAERSDR